MPAAFRQLPSVDRLLQEERVRVLIGQYSHAAVASLVREALEEARRRIAAGAEPPTLADLIGDIEERARRAWQPSLVPVINATGVIIHTNLGRAVLSDEAIAAAVAAASGYSNLEYDLDRGERGSRHAHLEGLLARLTGAEAGIAVNNNAAAVLLALTALAQGREVVVSRGQAVEIGGGFRIPEVMRQSGAQLVEVGTTNRTYIEDYAAALGAQTALLLRVHTSNFRITGFAHSVPLSELVALGRQHGLPVMDDLGSGALLDTAQYSLAHEPMVQESIAAGASVVCFSGDKLLGGPQAGVIVGQEEYLDRLGRHPLARAVRIDKLTLAALQATLLHYAKGEAPSRIPVWQMIGAPVAELARRAEACADVLRRWGLAAKVIDGASTVGGGSLPGETLPTKLVALLEGEGSGQVPSVAALAERLRGGEGPVIGRIERGMLLLDPRTVLPKEDQALLRALERALAGVSLLSRGVGDARREEAAGAQRP